MFNIFALIVLGSLILLNLGLLLAPRLAPTVIRIRKKTDDFALFSLFVLLFTVFILLTSIKATFGHF